LSFGFFFWLQSVSLRKFSAQIMSFKSIKRSVLALFVATLFSLPAIAQEGAPVESHDAVATATEAHVEGHEAAHGEEGKFDAKKVLLEHVMDSHSWHLWGHTSLPLPVLVYSDKGFESFMSDKLMDEHHHPVTFQANYPYKLVEDKLKVVNEDGSVNEELTAKVYDLSITKNVLAMFFGMALMFLLFMSVASAYKRRPGQAPKGLQSFMEPLILFVRDEIAAPNIGPRYKRYMPFLLTLFFFIWINNLLGLIPIIPGGANLTGNIAFTLTLAVITFLVVTFSGNGNYWKHIFWMPDVPVPIKIFLAPIELLGIFIKPVSLMIRLFANITAGHILVLGLISLIFIFQSVGASAVSVPFAVFISVVELLVAFLQAFIFTLLASLYIGAAVEEHHHDDQGHDHAKAH